jgi:Holliday junction resolvase
MSMHCPNHPSDFLFEDLTSDYKRIRHICLTCIAEEKLPFRIQKRETTIEDARREVRWNILLGDAAKSVLYGALPIFVLAFFFVSSLIPSRGLGGIVSTGVGIVILLLLLLILFRVMSLRQAQGTPLPSVESIRKELESSYPQQAAAGVQRFKDNLHHRYEIEASGIAETDKMPGVRFERFLADFFERRGFAITRTPGSGDYGVDLVLQKGGKRTAVQCKRWEGGVGVAAIQEVHAGKDFYKCDGAMVVTNARFSEQAQRMAERLGIELWDRKRLTAELSRTQLRVSWEEYLGRAYLDFYFLSDCPTCRRKNRVLYSQRTQSVCGNCEADLPWH